MHDVTAYNSSRFRCLDCMMSAVDVCSETVCATSHTGAVQQAECLRGLDVQTMMSVFPWHSWLNEHFYWIPSPQETSTVIAIVDGKCSVALLSYNFHYAHFMPYGVLSVRTSEPLKDFATACVNLHRIKYIFTHKQPHVFQTMF